MQMQDHACKCRAMHEINWLQNFSAHRRDSHTIVTCGMTGPGYDLNRVGLTGRGLWQTKKLANTPGGRLSSTILKENGWPQNLCRYCVLRDMSVSFATASTSHIEECTNSLRVVGG